MKLIFLGAGSAFTVGKNNYQSNMLLQNDNGQNILIDCGGDCRLSLYEQGYSYDDIDAVFISHLHADHIGGLEWLAFTSYFDPNCKKPKLYIAETIKDDLWDKALAAGLSSLYHKVAHLDTFFDVHTISDKRLRFSWRKQNFKLIKTRHAMCGFKLMPSYGLMFTINNKKILLTGDVQFRLQEMHSYYDEADLIFQDCETLAMKTSVHAHYDELATLPEAIKNKMWLYGYNPGPLPRAKKAGFLGFVKQGQVFDF